MINKKEVMDLARYEIQRDPTDPYKAIINALNRWLIKKNYKLVPVLPKGKVIDALSKAPDGSEEASTPTELKD